jgi:tetratricopeptide (TPR) repeat protein
LTGFPSRVAAIAIATLPLVASSTVMSIVAFDAAYAQNNGNGNGNGGRNGNGGGNGGGPPAHANAGRGDADEDTPRRTGPPAHANAGGSLQGRIARELGGANASNASAQAFANASDESMIGRLREVYEYLGETDSALSDLEAKQEAFDMAVAEYLESGEDLRLGDEIEASITDVNQRIADLEALDPPPDDFDDQLADLEEELEGYTAELEDYESAVGEAESDLAGAEDAYDEALEAEDEALAGVTNPNFELSDEARDELRSRLYDRLGDPNAEPASAEAPEET